MDWPSLATFLPSSLRASETLVATAVVIALAAVTASARVLHKHIQRERRSNEHFPALRKLFRTAMNKLVDAETSGHELERGEWRACQEALSALDTDQPAFAADSALLIKRLMYLEDKLLRVLESLDNVKPNGLFVEHYLSTGGTDDPHLDIDGMVTAVLQQLTRKSATLVTESAGVLKRRKKKLSSTLLSLMKQVDKSVADVRQLQAINTTKS